MVIALTLVVFSCGFKPLYAKKDKSHGYKPCTNFTVEKVESHSISGQRLQYRLQDALNQACINTDTQYRIVLENISRVREGVGIRKDREVTRYNLNINARFAVIDITQDKTIYRGSSIMVGGFDAQVSDYGTYALEDDTERKLFEDMANDIALKISSNLFRRK